MREGRAERDRIDLFVRVPQRVRVRVETRGGAVDVSGPLSEAEALTVVAILVAIIAAILVFRAYYYDYYFFSCTSAIREYARDF